MSLKKLISGGSILVPQGGGGGTPKTVKNTDICLDPFGGFGGLVPPNYVKIVLF